MAARGTPETVNSVALCRRSGRPELGRLSAHAEGSWLPKAEAGVRRAPEAQA